MGGWIGWWGYFLAVGMSSGYYGPFWGVGGWIGWWGYFLAVGMSSGYYGPFSLCRRPFFAVFMADLVVEVSGKP